MLSPVEKLFDDLWKDYISITPSALNIHQLLTQHEQQGSNKAKSLVNDHIALRTFNIEKINLDKLAAHFLALGYNEKGQYDFEQKKLKAKHFEHKNEKLPKVFISELLVEHMPSAVQTIIHKLVDYIPENANQSSNFLHSGTHWPISIKEYETLAEHSEYAAWMSVWGFRANHFTININQMSQANSVEQINQLLKQAGYVLNSAGGEIKGGPEVLLAQSSTMADSIEVSFTDGKKQVPSCFYEFAYRYPLPNGKLYQGFVAASADKIFESTNR